MRFTVVFCCCLALGCGSGSPYDYERVSGKLTYEDGTTIPGGGLRLRFVALDAPQVENAVPRHAFANIDANGEFASVTSHKFGDGLIPGKHKVAIEKEGLPDARAPVPKEYLSINTTPLTVDTADAPFHIKVPKPDGKK
jgi:hypothetical protein